MTEGTSPSRLRRFLMFPAVRLFLSLCGLSALSALPGLARHLAHQGRPSMLVQEAASATAGILVLLFLARVYERRPLAEVGLAREGALRDLLVGFGIGAGLFTLSVSTLAALGFYHVVGFYPPPPGHGWVMTLGKLLLLFALVGVFEEVLFRGLIFRILEEGLGTFGALAVSALLFGFAHFSNPGASVTSSVAIVLEAGVMLGAAFVLNRGLSLVVGIHWAWNFFEGPIYGTQVSGTVLPSWLHASVTGPVNWTGGAFGPEAGGVVMIFGSLLAAVFLTLAWKRGQFRPAPWVARRRARNMANPATPPTA